MATHTVTQSLLARQTSANADRTGGQGHHLRCPGWTCSQGERALETQRIRYDCSDELPLQPQSETHQLVDWNQRKFSPDCEVDHSRVSTSISMRRDFSFLFTSVIVTSTVDIRTNQDFREILTEFCGSRTQVRTRHHATVMISSCCRIITSVDWTQRVADDKL
jgi:hypothetical protein